MARRKSSAGMTGPGPVGMQKKPLYVAVDNLPEARGMSKRRKATPHPGIRTSPSLENADPQPSPSTGRAPAVDRDVEGDLRRVGQLLGRGGKDDRGRSGGQSSGSFVKRLKGRGSSLLVEIRNLARKSTSDQELQAVAKLVDARTSDMSVVPEVSTEPEGSIFSPVAPRSGRVLCS